MDNSRNVDRAKAKRACCELEVAGFRIVEESTEIGRDLFVEVAWKEAPSADSLNYEELVDLHVALARQCLKSTGIAVEPIPIGRHLLIQVSTRRKPVGRPSDDEVRRLAQRLKDDGFSYPRIAAEIARVTGVTRTPDAYRKLLAYPKASR
jgi:hypothetical protein